MATNVGRNMQEVYDIYIVINSHNVIRSRLFYSHGGVITFAKMLRLLIDTSFVLTTKINNCAATSYFPSNPEDGGRSYTRKVMLYWLY
jgi:hypothetical protein